MENLTIAVPCCGFYT